MAETEDPQKLKISPNFAPFASACGGIALGSVVVSRMFLYGKITGISGTVAGLIVSPRPADWASRAAFTGGLLASGGAMTVKRVGVVWGGDVSSG